MADLRFVSPERRWRAAAMVVLAAWFGWRAVRYAGPGHVPALVADWVLAAALLASVVPIMRSCLIVTDAGVIDRRAVRIIRVPWAHICEFRVQRPGGLWGGFCVVAGIRDGTPVDLLSTRAYSRTASPHHLDELPRMCWTLEHRLASRGEPSAADPP